MNGRHFIDNKIELIMLYNWCPKHHVKVDESDVQLDGRCRFIGQIPQNTFNAVLILKFHLFSGKSPGIRLNLLSALSNQNQNHRLPERTQVCSHAIAIALS